MKFNEALNRRWHGLDGSDPNHKDGGYVQMRNRDESKWEQNEKPEIVSDYINRLSELPAFRKYPKDVLATDVNKMVKRYKNSKGQYVATMFSKVRNGLIPYANSYKQK